MRVIYSPSLEEVAELRKKTYIEAWPIEKQLEAHAEALGGRPEKQQQMLEDFAKIRESLPYRR